MKGKHILNLPMRNDCGPVTIGETLRAMLRNLIIEADSFSGKRPLGNSGWHADFAVALIDAGVVEGVVDSDGEPDDYDWKQVDKALLKAVEAVFK